MCVNAARQRRGPLRKGKNMTINEKAVYLRGLADGLNYDKTTAEGKLIAALIDLVGDLAEAIEEIDEDLEYLNDYIEEIDEDLGSVEEDIYLDDDCECCCDDDNDDDEDEECDCCCCHEGCCGVECPSCGEVVEVDCDDQAEEIVCPSCGEKIATLLEEDN